MLPTLPLMAPLSVCPLQPQTNSTKNSAATSPKGTLPPAALVLSPSAPYFLALLHPACLEAWGEGGVRLPACL